MTHREGSTKLVVREGVVAWVLPITVYADYVLSYFESFDSSHSGSSSVEVTRHPTLSRAHFPAPGGPSPRLRRVIPPPPAGHFPASGGAFPAPRGIPRPSYPPPAGHFPASGGAFPASGGAFPAPRGIPRPPYLLT